MILFAIKMVIKLNAKMSQYKKFSYIGTLSLYSLSCYLKYIKNRITLYLINSIFYANYIFYFLFGSLYSTPFVSTVIDVIITSFLGASLELVSTL